MSPNTLTFLYLLAALGCWFVCWAIFRTLPTMSRPGSLAWSYAFAGFVMLTGVALMLAVVVRLAL